MIIYFLSLALIFLVAYVIGKQLTKLAQTYFETNASLKQELEKHKQQKEKLLKEALAKQKEVEAVFKEIPTTNNQKNQHAKNS